MVQNKKRIISLILMLTLLVSSLVIGAITASAADTTVTFALGADGSASHYDGSSKTSHSYTEGSYTLNITNGTNMYCGARDANGNGCIKLGTSKAAGSFSFTVPNDVTEVKIFIANYKDKSAGVKINDTSYSLTKKSNSGEYDVISVDTSSTKTVKVATVSDDKRAMVNTIEFVIPAVEEGDCEHEWELISTTAATCTTAGEEYYECASCGESMTEAIDALGHSYGEANITTAPTCTGKGEQTSTCTVCGDVKIESINSLGHNFVNGSCDVCGEAQPLEVTITFDNTNKMTSSSASQQIWEENGIKITYDKNTYNNNLAEYASPIRFYAGTKITVSYSGITGIKIAANTDAYATVIGNSIENSIVNGKEVTYTFSEATDSFSFVPSAQIRVDSITVYVAASECAHENTNTTTVDATCTTDGSITVTCDDCGNVTTDTIPATGHQNTTTTTVDATCAAVGSVTVTCNDCNTQVSKTVIPNSGFIKVTEDLDDWSGVYLVVYGEKVLNGTLNGSIDAASNYVNIDVASDMTPYAFIISKNEEGKYTIKTQDGYYIGLTSENNDLLSNASKVYTNEISINEDGTINIVSESGYYLRFNDDANGNRFRYYSSTSQEPLPTLYKFVSVDHVPGAAADCENAQTCTVCGEEIAPALGHNTEGTVTHVDATCTEDGVVGGTYCTRCNNGKAAAEAAITAPGHTEVTHEAKAPTCTEIGWNAYVTCENCDYSTYEELAPTCATNAIHNEGVEAGCHTTGLKENWYCANCDVYYLDAACTIVTSYKNLVIPAANTLTQVEAKAPTCTAVGYDAYEYCSACDYTTYNEIPVIAHDKYDDCPHAAKDAEGNLYGSVVEALSNGVSVTLVNNETVEELVINGAVLDLGGYTLTTKATIVFSGQIKGAGELVVDEGNFSVLNGATLTEVPVKLSATDTTETFVFRAVKDQQRVDVSVNDEGVTTHSFVFKPSFAMKDVMTNAELFGTDGTYNNNISFGVIVTRTNANGSKDSDIIYVPDTLVYGTNKAFKMTLTGVTDDYVYSIRVVVIYDNTTVVYQGEIAYLNKKETN